MLLEMLLTSYLSRHADHVVIYKEQCKKKAIPMHPRALANDKPATLSAQGTLDDVIVSQPYVPPFTIDGLLDYEVQLVVINDEANIASVKQ